MELLVWRELIADTMRALRALGREEEHRETVELLCGIPGIGIVTAMVFLAEVIDIHRFKHADRFASSTFAARRCKRKRFRVPRAVVSLILLQPYFSENVIPSTPLRTNPTDRSSE